MIGLPLLSGFLSSASLIVAIGSQNAFVLRQGLKREHVGPVVAFCALSDLMLMTIGVYGLATIVLIMPAILPGLRIAGISFLLIYAGLSFYRAWCGNSRQQTEDESEIVRFSAIFPMLAGLTWLNPHVWLDTVVLLGSLAQNHAGAAKVLFLIGAAGASCLWFCCLGYGARALSPLFRKPMTWVILDVLIGAMMLGIAVWMIFRI